LHFQNKKNARLLYAGQWHSPHNKILNDCPTDVFNKQLTIHRMWPTRFPGFSPCDYSLWEDRGGLEFMYTIHILSDRRPTVFKEKLSIF